MGAFRLFWNFVLFISVVVAFADVQDQRLHPKKAVGRQDRPQALIFFKNEEIKNGREQFLPRTAVEKQDRRVLFAFRNQGSSSKRLALDTVLRNSKSKAKRDTVLAYKNLKLEDDVKRENKRREMISKLKNDKLRDYFMRRVPVSQKVKRDISAASGTAVEKQDRKVIFAFRNQGSSSKRLALDTVPREAEKKEASNQQKDRKSVIIGFKGQELEYVRPEKLRDRRDLASTVVGAAVSQVVANLMSNKHKDAPPVPQNDVYYEPAGNIYEAGPVAPISNEAVPRPFAPKNSAPVANEIVPLPFAPIRKDAAPVANEIVPLPFAPIRKDVVPLPLTPIKVDVVVIASSTSTDAAVTSSTAKPSETKKGFWSTLLGSIKLFFGTVTNSVGGFFIDIGQRVTGFVENRIKV